MHTAVHHEPPNWSKMHAEKCTKLVFDFGTEEGADPWIQSTTFVKIDYVPFAAGSLRNAYFMLDLGDCGAELAESGYFDQTAGIAPRGPQPPPSWHASAEAAPG